MSAAEPAGGRRATMTAVPDVYDGAERGVHPAPVDASSGWDSGPSLGVDMHGVCLAQRKRTIYGPVSFAVNPGGLLVLDGPIGSGRTCLLLTIGGRMRATSGHGTVACHAQPQEMKQIRRHVALGPFPHLNDLDTALSIEQHLAETLLLHRFSLTLSIGRRRVGEVLDSVNERLDALEPLARRVYSVVASHPGDPNSRVVPRLTPGTRVADMSPLEQFTLSTVLALLDNPDVLLVDDVDELRSVDERARAWALLLALRETEPEHPLTIVASCEHNGLAPETIGDAAHLARREIHILDLPACRISASASPFTPRPTR